MVAWRDPLHVPIRICRMVDEKVRVAGGGLLVLRDEVAPLLGVELLRERRRADQVTDEDGQLATLARLRCGFRPEGRRWSAGRSGRGREPLAAATAELLELTDELWKGMDPPRGHVDWSNQKWQQRKFRR